MPDDTVSSRVNRKSHPNFSSPSRAFDPRLVSPGNVIRFGVRDIYKRTWARKSGKNRKGKDQPSYRFTSYETGWRAREKSLSLVGQRRFTVRHVSVAKHAEKVYTHTYILEVVSVMFTHTTCSRVYSPDLGHRNRATPFHHSCVSRTRLATSDASGNASNSFFVESLESTRLWCVRRKSACEVAKARDVTVDFNIFMGF